MTPIITRVAHARYDDHRLRGHGVLAELLGRESYMGLVALALTGRRLSPRDARALDALGVSLAAADPRIWPLKITRLLASYGGALGPFVAGQLCTEGSTIGGWVTGAAADLLLCAEAAARAAPNPHEALCDLVRRTPRLPGFGVALRPADERFVALARELEAQGRTREPHWRSFVALSAAVRDVRAIEPNIVAGGAALLLDLGFDVPGCAMMGHYAIQPAWAANAVEAAADRASVMRRLPDECVRYAGRGPRASPAARPRA